MKVEVEPYLEHPRILPLDRPRIIPAILFAQLLVITPLFQQVNIWVTITSLVAIAWRLGHQYKDWSLPGKWSRLFIGMLAAAAVIFEHKALFTKDAGLSLFVVMSSLRMLELNRLRDGMNSIFLAFFLLSINFLYSQSILMAGYALFAIFWLLLCLNGLQSLQGFKSFKKPSSVAINIFLITLPLTIILFLFFPRLSHPLWMMPSSSNSSSGVSDSMTPGDISALTLGEEIAFRVKFLNNVPPPSNLYWRGLVLSEFDGLTWSRGAPQGEGSTITLGEAIEYTVFLEPHERNWLFFLDIPVKNKDTPHINKKTNEQFTNEIPDKLFERLQYKGVSYPEHISVLELSEESRENYLQLPSSGNQLTRDWAAELRSQVANDESFINRVLQHIYQQPFRYTLTPDILAVEGIDDFWFNTQNGFCEHYASNLTFIARAAGIPARIVIGYQGGEKNPYSGNWVVRQANAHAWTEIWLQGQGWKRIDPTAAIHPSRVEQDAARGYRQRDLFFDASDFGEWFVDKGWLHDFRQMWEAVNNSWQKWVIEFNQESQSDLMEWAGLGEYSWSRMFRIILFATGISLLLWFLNTFGGREKFEPSVELYMRLCRRLAKFNFPRELNEGPKDYLQRIKTNHPGWISKAEPVIENYIDFRYREIDIDKNRLKTLSKCISKIKNK